MSFSEYIQNSINPVLIASKVNSTDIASSIIALAKVFQQQNHSLTIIIRSNTTKKYFNQFKDNGIEVLKELRPLNYEVWVDYGKSGVKKVTYDIDEKDKKLKFIITPSDSGFDFKNVEFKEGGSSHDLTILFEVEDPKSLGEFYENNDYIFRDVPIISITRSGSEFGSHVIRVGEDESYSEKIYDELRQSEFNLDKDITEVLLKGTVSYRKILEGESTADTWSKISSMVAQGVDFNKMINEIYYSKSHENLNVYIKLMQNVKILKERRLLWSGITKKDLAFYSITEKNLDIRGRIPFNISRDFDLAVAVYEVAPNTLKTVIESNQPEVYDANKIAKIFGGKGSSTHSICTIKELSINEFESRFLSLLDDMKDESITPEVITKK